MQFKILVFLALLSAACSVHGYGYGYLARRRSPSYEGRRRFTQGYDDQPRESEEAFAEILVGGYLDTDTAGEVDVVSELQNKGLQEAAEIAQTVNLNNILNDAATPYTLFAPTDDAVRAWKEQLSGVTLDQTRLTRLCKAWIVPHIIESSDIVNEKVVQSLNGFNLRLDIYEQQQKVTVNGAEIVQLGDERNNGIIHVVNHVIYPLPENNAFVTLKKLHGLSMFIQLVQRANMEHELQEDGITVFAPDNGAFINLGQDFLADLQNDDSRSELQKFLRYHVIKGTWYSAGLSDGQKQKAKEGNLIKISKENDRIYLNRDANDDAQSRVEIVHRDIPTTNGVIHIINNALRPKGTHLTWM